MTRANQKGVKTGEYSWEDLFSSQHNGNDLDFTDWYERIIEKSLGK